uniref:Unc 112 protein n=2 Tax=Echinococcus granulosus TaxID=6210 RepID=A0A068WL74_ECHGR|nr:unc 112 protein [Echinococcus granulosus]
MISDGGHYVDGSWLLSVRIDSLNVDREMRVKGDWSIGRVLVGLIEGLAHPQKLACEASDISLSPGIINSGWSDFALWWPLKNRWILQTHASLDQYGLQADARLHFIRVHGRLRVQLPDLQTRVFCDVNFTEPVFRLVILICKHLGIAHPEELSLQYPDFDRFCIPVHGKMPSVWNEQWSTLPASARRSFKKLAFTSPSKTDLRQKRPASCILSPTDQTDKPARNVITNNQTMLRRPQVYGPPRVRNRPISGNSPLSPTRPDSVYLSQSLCGAPLSKLEICDDPSLISSPQMPLSEALTSGSIQRQCGFFARARFSNVWLELGRSLMEQGIYPATLNLDDTLDSATINPETEGKENGVNGVETDTIPMLRLRFKYNAFYDLTLKNSAVRINQLFEQARWSVVSETIECTNEEAALFAALQLQLRQISSSSDPQSSSREPRSFSISGEIVEVNGHSRSISPPLSQPVRRPSSSFGSDAFISRPANPSVQDLDHEIDLLLDDLTTTCLQQDRSNLIRGGPSSTHHFPRRFSTPYRPRWERNSRNGGGVEVSLPELAAYLKVCKPRAFGIKTYRRFYVVLKKTSLLIFKTQEDCQNSQLPVDSVCLLGCESWPDLSPTSDRYALRIFTPLLKQALPLSSALRADSGVVDGGGMGDSDSVSLTTRLKRRASLLSLTSLGGLNAVCGRAVSRASGLLNELILRLPDEAHYIEWAAAVRLAGSLSLGCSGAATPETVRRLFEAEKRATTSLLQLLTPLPTKITSLRTDSKNPVGAAERLWLLQNISIILPYRLAGEQAGGGGTTQSKASEPIVPTTGALSPAKEEANERLVRHIMDIRGRLTEMSAMEVKLQYIGHWQQLTGNGVIYFVARFETSVPVATALGLPADTPDQAYRTLSFHSSHIHPTSRQVTISFSRRDEVVGIGNGRVARHDPTTGEIHAAWRLEVIQGWNVNRELNELVLMLAPTATSPSTTTITTTINTTKSHLIPTSFPSTGGRVVIRPIGVPVQKVSEVLGANVFLSLRSPTKSQELDEALFYRLIGASPMKSLYANITPASTAAATTLAR